MKSKVLPGTNGLAVAGSLLAAATVLLVEDLATTTGLLLMVALVGNTDLAASAFSSIFASLPAGMAFTATAGAVLPVALLETAAPAACKVATDLVTAPLLVTAAHTEAAAVMCCSSIADWLCTTVQRGLAAGKAA